jgi:hypothetical protein
VGGGQQRTLSQKPEDSVDKHRETLLLLELLLLVLLRGI